MAFSDWGAISALRGWEHVAARDQSASLVPLLPRARVKKERRGTARGPAASRSMQARLEAREVSAGRRDLRV